MITIHRELTNALAIPKECSQESLLCFVFYSNIFQIEVLSLRHKTNPNMRLRKDRSELATDQRKSQIRVKKKWPWDWTWGPSPCLTPKAPLLDTHSILTNFLPPDVFFQSSHFHESNVMRLSWLSYFTGKNGMNIYKILWKMKLILILYPAQSQKYSKC